MATQYMKDKPTAEDFAYVYAETADGALVRVPKSKVTGERVTVDSALSETSTNPVQNKVVAEKFNELSEEFDSLEIGGRNLIPNTKSMSGWYTTANSNVALSADNEGFTVCTWNATDALNWNSLGTRAPIQFSEVRGKTVTLSCLVRSDDYESINAASGQGFAITFALCTATSLTRTLYGGINWYTTDLSDKWMKLSWTGVLDDDFFASGTGTIDDTTRMYLQFYNRSLYSMQVKKIKLELGNVATDWSPAPEDSGYTLPIATADTLGGVKPVAKTDAMTQSVGVDANGALYTASGGGESRGGGFRLLRVVTIPESIETDASGVNFAEQPNGGVIFGFDTDEDGEPFSCTELYVISYAGTDHTASGFGISVDSDIPSDGGIAGLSTQIIIGTNGSFKYSMCLIDIFDDGRSLSMGATFGGGLSNLQTLVKQVVQGNAYVKAEKVRVYMKNVIGYGFSAGSEFRFYGR